MCNVDGSMLWKVFGSVWQGNEVVVAGGWRLQVDATLVLVVFVTVGLVRWVDASLTFVRSAGIEFTYIPPLRKLNLSIFEKNHAFNLLHYTKASIDADSEPEKP